MRALRGATGGASEWRPPLAWCQEVLRNPYAHHGGRLQLHERGPRTKGALGKFLRSAQGHNPWASSWWNHLKASAHAAGDGLTPAAQGLALSSPPRARCSRSAENRNAALCDYRIVPQLHRFSSDIIVNSVACEDAVSTGPDLF